ncbi:ArsR/SmtB family transcription factor [Pyrodictium delaneyi]|uniref:HTH arsR-type domain-containing protein n=1 Tax=Pyrodictium delaneyi TaxID=1273541 RepID=A0A211YRB4_9CREN|nr:helix-turn-helix domain-containing protein [Pyrodictium delaneyi]OWJ55598.1 hypothetical protein Pdsh_02080 [Pyrodictium delaneyi]
MAPREWRRARVPPRKTRRRKGKSSGLDVASLEAWLGVLQEKSPWKITVLRLLLEKPRMTSELLRAAGTPYTTLTGWLKRMENRGLVESTRVGPTNWLMWSLDPDFAEKLREAMKNLGIPVPQTKTQPKEAPEQ